MASRKSKSSWLLRDLPRSYVVIGIAVAAATIIAFSVGWSNPPPSPATAGIAQPTQAELEKQYRGTITLPTDQNGICLNVLLDNRTGRLSAGGYGQCVPDEPREVVQESPQQSRLHALSGAFRR